MKYKLITPQELDENLQARWCALRAASSVYASPYYHPQYTLLLGQILPDVRILLIEDKAEIVGFFPLQLQGMQGKVLGGGLTDYQGPICAGDIQLNVREILRGMQIHYMRFNHMPSERSEFARYAWKTSRSQVMHLEQGFAAYADNLQASREAGLLKKIDTYARKLGKNHGDLRFEMQSTSQADFAALLQGKSEQMHRTGQADIFAVPWIRQFIDAIRAQTQIEFSGMLSTLYAGDTLVAAHFGMRSKHVLHYWFPWYHTDFSAYSPGLILLASCAREAEQHGIGLIDLGRGEQAYKLRFATGSIALCEGAISNPAWLSLAQAKYLHIREGFKHSSLGQKIRQWRSNN